VSVDFWSPSYRASSSDLTVAISPLGLVELADEEFEVHGPRLNRYAAAWAWYLGHHWSHRREMGDLNLTLNYVRTMSDYITNFCFGKGVQFTTPEFSAAIIPHVLQKVWEVDNNKQRVLWEMGQLAGVTGDCFVKIAYEGAWEDTLGVVHEGRTRILPLNPAHCFPEYHPHDRDRLLRFKLKYRFWGCVDTDTEALTMDGWKRYDEITTDDKVLALDPDTDEITWQPVESVEVYDYDGHMVYWDNHMDAVTTPNHRWVADRQRGSGDTLRYEREIVRTEVPIDDDVALKALRKGSRLILGGGTPLAFRDAPKFSDELVETVGWYVTEGWDHVNQTGAQSVYLSQKREEGVSRIRRIQNYWQNEGATFTEYSPKSDGVINWYLGKGVGTALREVAPNKSLTPEFISSLTFTQAHLLYDTLMLADGNVRRGSERWTQLDVGRVDGFQMLCAMLGKRTRYAHEKVQVYKSRHVDSRSTVERARRVHTKDGKIWSPVLNGGEGVWFARRNGSTYWTGNTSPEGTRQVYTFTEILTDDTVEQYVNDEMIDQYDNPIGVIPVVHIPNVSISSSPWGQSDIWDIISLNREMNEKMTEISDIINYHCLSEDTEALTPDGWKHHYELSDGDLVMTIDPETGEMAWQEARINRFDYDGELVQWSNHVDALSTTGHRWIVDRRHGRDRAMVREFSTTAEVPTLTQGSRIVLGGGVPTAFSDIAKYTDEQVELAGWLVTEGCLVTLPSGAQHFTLHQSDTANPQHVDSIRRLAAHFRNLGYKFTEQRQRDNGVIGWYLGTDLSETMLHIIPGKLLTSSLVSNLTVYQARTLLQTLMDGDGSAQAWYQNDRTNRDSFQMLCSMLGHRTRSFENNRGDGVVTLYKRNHTLAEHTTPDMVPYKGVVWCPTVENGTWLARRNGCTYWTGNSAPVTIITGAKASQLERGARKVWAGLPKDSKVYNLESRGEMGGAMEYVSVIKQAMHEITGVPEGALGKAQPISNTSGVALAIQYQPMMNRYSMKRTHFDKGLVHLNEIIIRTQAVHEPESLSWNPWQATVPERDQADVLDPRDPITYRTAVHWPEPLPVDQLIKLNEIQAKMSLGLESKRGALRLLGEEFPAQKMAEVVEELQDDALDQGALELINAHIQSAIVGITGMVPADGSVPAVVSAGGPTVTSAGQEGPAGILPGINPSGDVVNQLTQRAYGANLAQRRVPGSESED
jgi:hypothetical protein